jgi:predicted Zn-dependent peptidase
MIKEKKKEHILTSKVCDSGMRIIVEEMPGYNSVTVNMNIHAGASSDAEHKGIAHLIEHMFFKGTKNLSTKELNIQLDLIAPTNNAFTSRDFTSFVGKTLNRFTPNLVKLFSDMYFNHKIDENALETEKKAIYKEMLMVDDNADRKVKDLSHKYWYKGTPYETDILGTPDSLAKIFKQDILNHIKTNFTPDNLIISFAGDITMEEAEKLVMENFEKHFTTTASPRIFKAKDNIIPKAKSLYLKKDTAQTRVCIKYPSFNYESNKRHALSLLNIALSAGASSILFENLRENKGYVYKAMSSFELTEYGGDFKILLTSSPEEILKTVMETALLMKDITENGIKASELEKAKTMIDVYLETAADNTDAVSTMNVLDLMRYNRTLTLKETLEELQSVTLNQVNQVAREIFGSENIVISSVGKDLSMDLLELYNQSINLEPEEENTQTA